MADGTLKVGTITNSAGSGNITIGSGVTLLSNVPAFLAFRNDAAQRNLSAQRLLLKVTVWNSEEYDTDDTCDNCFKFIDLLCQVSKAGKYRLYYQVGGYCQTGGDSNCK